LATDFWNQNTRQIRLLQLIVALGGRHSHRKKDGEEENRPVFGQSEYFKKTKATAEYVVFHRKTSRKLLSAILIDAGSCCS
jgi:hypothetical protein